MATGRKAGGKRMNEMEEIFDNLQELTGYESGIVLYPNKYGELKEGIVMNWSSEIGVPVISPFGGLMSWPIPIKVKSSRTISKEELLGILEDLTEVLNYSSASDEEINASVEACETVQLTELTSGEVVITFSDWA